LLRFLDSLFVVTVVVGLLSGAVVLVGMFDGAGNILVYFTAFRIEINYFATL